MPSEIQIAQNEVAERFLDFWITAGPERWFDQDDDFDRAFRGKFLSLYEVAMQGGCASWISTASSALSLVVLFDQFPRNAFRESPQAYASDPLARAAATAAIERGHDKHFGLDLRGFFYMPFMHSEDLVDQDRSIELQRELAWDWRRPAARHRAIIAAFGRFPHRNAILGRVTTPEEQRYLDGGGFAG